MIPSPTAVEMLGYMGFDWVLIDNEHGSITVDTAEEMARVNWQFLQHEGSTDVITFDHSAPGAPASGPACSTVPIPTPGGDRRSAQYPPAVNPLLANSTATGFSPMPRLFASSRIAAGIRSSAH